MAQFNVGNLLETARPVWAIDGEGNILGLAAHPVAIQDGGNSLTVDGSVFVASASPVIAGTLQIDDGLAATRAGHGI
jgi:hypothetical protein